MQLQKEQVPQGLVAAEHPLRTAVEDVAGERKGPRRFVHLMQLVSPTYGLGHS